MKSPTPNRVRQAWALIQKFDLNEQLTLGGQSGPRFQLVNAKGFAVGTPDNALAVFDMRTGRTFLPQLDADWFEQLVMRFRVAVRWNEPLQTWEAEVSGVVRNAPTPADAVVDVLVAAFDEGRPPPKYPFEGSTHRSLEQPRFLANF